MTIADDIYRALVQASLPVQEVLYLAADSCSISWLPNSAMTMEQLRKASDILLQFTRPEEYAERQSDIANTRDIKNQYSEAITRLQQIQDAASVPFTQAGFSQVVQAIKDEALYLQKILKYHAIQLRNDQ